jgi:hypothetical protein
MNPLVSICIPAYNAERFIAETLESALAQKYSNKEIIVSDDCSTDHTVEVVERYASKGVRLIQLGKNVGRYGNCNIVIRTSRGKYVLKLDADDLVDPDHAAEQVSVMEANPEIVFAHCACRLIDADGRHIGFERSINGSFIRSGFQEWPRYVFGPRAINIVTIRRSAFDRVGGYDERYQYSGDWAMHRALLRIGSVFYNDHVIASYRVHSVGKEGVRLLQAREPLMHIRDMQDDWPDEVANQDVLLQQARLRLGLGVARMAVSCENGERAQILELLPAYGSSRRIQLLLTIIRLGGAPFVRLHTRNKERLRQAVKRRLYARAKAKS